MDTDLNKDPEYTKFDTSKVVLTERAVACVESLHGVPDEWLEDRAAAKALLAWKIYEEHGYYNEEDDLFLLDGIGKDFTPQFLANDGATLSADSVIQAAKELRKKDGDFGELNELIDSFKE